MDFPEFGSGFAPLRMNCTNFGYPSAFLLTSWSKVNLMTFPSALRCEKSNTKKALALRFKP